MKHEQNRKEPRAPLETAGFLLFIVIFSAITLGISALFLLLSGEMPVMSATEEDDGADRLVVILDAGHGGEDGGAVGVDGTKEKDLNLDLTLMLAAQLRAAGVTVILTREDDRLLYDKNGDYAGKKKQLDLAARLGAMADTKEDCPEGEILFISIHMNSYPSPSVSGFQVWYSGNDPSSKTLAEAVQQTVCRSLQPDNKRAVKLSGSNIYLLDRATLPAILVECGFLTNAEECRMLSSEEYRRELAFSMALAILKFHSDAEVQS
jgi:N-acetylmuramoyl-L-alanine amidase